MRNERTSVTAGGETAVRDRASAPSETTPLLSDPRRRRAVERLRTVDGPIGLAELADEVAATERGTIVGEVPPEDVKPVSISLYHSHVPKLAEADVVEYDRESDLIGLSADAERAAPSAEGR